MSDRERDLKFKLDLIAKKILAQKTEDEANFQLDAAAYRLEGAEKKLKIALTRCVNATNESKDAAESDDAKAAKDAADAAAKAAKNVADAAATVEAEKTKFAAAKAEYAKAKDATNAAQEKLLIMTVFPYSGQEILSGEDDSGSYKQADKCTLGYLLGQMMDEDVIYGLSRSCFIRLLRSISVVEEFRNDIMPIAINNLLRV